MFWWISSYLSNYKVLSCYLVEMTKQYSHIFSWKSNFGPQEQRKYSLTPYFLLMY